MVRRFYISHYTKIHLTVILREAVIIPSQYQAVKQSMFSLLQITAPLPTFAFK